MNARDRRSPACRRGPGPIRALLACLAAAALLPAWTTAAPQDVPGEAVDQGREIRTAFLYHFARFATWPADAALGPGGTFVFLVVEDEPFAAALERALGNKRILDRPVRVLRCRYDQHADSCAVEYISARDPQRLRERLRILGPRPILTVSESPDFLEGGGMINFVVEDHRIAFEIDRGAVERARLRLSSKLLALARNAGD